MKNVEKNILLPIQQGEVLLLPIDNLPSGNATAHTSYICAHSESGHHHVLESKTKFEVMSDGEKQELYLRLFDPAKLVHQKTFDKHRTLDVPAGVYRVLHKTEYSPWESVIRRVQD